jgi:phytanoyl-CoA hydroxylase
MLDAALFQKQGYVVAEGLFSSDELQNYRVHYMRLHDKDAPDSYSNIVDMNHPDPLKQYPRIMQPHRWDELSLKWLLDKRLEQAFEVILGTAPYAVQTMFYFKPPGARGQALHQDQYYLRVQPGTCVAAWMALDDCDEENGCLQVVPGTHDTPILCLVEADTEQSFTDVTVPIPEGYAPEPVMMKAGDVLFFNGQLIHGSFPNMSKNRFRRTLIGHYVLAEAQQVAKYYHPVLRFDGSTMELETSADGGQCGVWVDKDGQTVVEIIDKAQAIQPEK